MSMSMMLMDAVSSLPLAPADPGDGSTGVDSFFKSSLGKAVIAVCGAIAILIAVVSIFRMIKHATSGKPGEAFKVMLGGFIVAALLFDLGVTTSALGSVGDLVGKVFDSADDVANTNK